MTYSFETSHPSPFMRVQHGPTAQPSISYLSFKTDGSALVIQNESYHGAQSDIFEEFIFEEKSVNLKNLKLIIANYAMKKNKHDENRNEN
ncbi:MAG: hypothetical protein BWY54_00217 [Candidatus Dependentiae bacterium ADurb.Bin331]|nr:MAG: hypothetical protein BWY54_00217 [Candidatus Dependentiae bacterium ADurb.Bin331]